MTAGLAGHPSSWPPHVPQPLPQVFKVGLRVGCICFILFHMCNKVKLLPLFPLPTLRSAKSTCELVVQVFHFFTCPWLHFLYFILFHMCNKVNLLPYCPYRLSGQQSLPASWLCKFFIFSYILHFLFHFFHNCTIGGAIELFYYGHVQ